MENACAESADSAGQKHVAKLADGGVSENLLDVGLYQSDGGSEECGGAADGGDDDQRGFRVFEQDVRAGDDVDAGSNHGGRVDQGAYGRRAFHGVGQPDVKRELRGFAAGSHEEQQARDGEDAENAPAFVRHVSGGVDVDQESDAGDYQDHDDGELVHLEIEAGAEISGDNPIEKFL